jgi:hypothetical protein
MNNTVTEKTRVDEEPKRGNLFTLFGRCMYSFLNEFRNVLRMDKDYFVEF